jgi:hypothetical protein
MYHTIEFNVDLWVDLERSPRHPLEKMLICRGSRRRAEVRPRIIENEDGAVEVADLFFEDGAAARGVPFAAFRFLE